ncbi:cellulose biosynthesis regulator YedQ [Raoultella sp. Lac2]|uniref:cellulose biosynthesis regulator diguanylate cyclase DgcQ n=1 Tax=Klebsiella/Raoultella group TaxID=2890311 RepID=UPI001152575C|nr:cellulose biosynthesis regulator diguanylate cyclase DgcQ [Klebsiella electrica]MXF46263.1 cellulose biosynthesis regulator YedQ [Raoultella sp. Lac2]MXF99410.1 cellulose biosynthesis regulator YedQ [Raoultella sp. Lac1]QDI07973.1 putative diguanylate cyclase YedQ [Klebsiella electrica]BBV75745.1 diguanylate cyclase [Raoultella planticola]
MDKPLWVRKLRRVSGPGHVVNYCFVAVLFFSTLLIWREVAVLEEAYVTNQRNNLENVAHEMDSLLLFNIDRMVFFRNGMQSALETPLDFEILRNAEQEYMSKRHDPIWSVALHNRRTLPVYGVSDAFVDSQSMLSRHDARTGNELMAALELGYLLRLVDENRGFNEGMLYISRSGFFTGTTLPKNAVQAQARYTHAIAAPWFTRQSQRNNPGRGVLWQTVFDGHEQNDDPVVTASVPLDFRHDWLGVLSMDFSVREMKAFLVSAIKGGQEGEYQLYDSRFNLIASSASGNVLTLLSAREQAMLSYAFSHQNQGSIRLLTRYISWQKLNNFDGVLLRTHTLQEGVRGAFGSITIALTLMWLFFTLMLIISWQVILRMVRNMSVMQKSLEWQAWHDALTRLLNRGALFDRAIAITRVCERTARPVSVIQLDLDYFKKVNDQHGHQAGDRVLSLVASTIASNIREGDLAGRVGGEEFCIVMPDTTLQMATAIAERIRIRIYNREILLCNDTSLRISASLGVSSSDDSAGFNFESLQSTADRRLYLAKQNGRNRVCFNDLFLRDGMGK